MNIRDILARDGIHCEDTVRVYVGPREYYLAELWIPDAASLADPPEEWEGETPEDPMGDHPVGEMVMVSRTGQDGTWEPAHFRDLAREREERWTREDWEDWRADDRRNDGEDYP